MYTIKKIDGLYRVVTASNERVLFSSARRISCKDFMRESLGYDESKEKQKDACKELESV